VNDPGTWMLLLYLYKGCMLAYGVYLAVATSGIRSELNETRYLGFSIYTMMLCGCVALPFVLGIPHCPLAHHNSSAGVILS
jgi:hypothetical protein